MFVPFVVMVFVVMVFAIIMIAVGPLEAKYLVFGVTKIKDVVVVEMGSAESCAFFHGCLTPIFSRPRQIGCSGARKPDVDRESGPDRSSAMEILHGGFPTPAGLEVRAGCQTPLCSWSCRNAPSKRMGRAK
jgi:hypothetical protein